jgi:hypothetical protein
MGTEAEIGMGIETGLRRDGDGIEMGLRRDGGGIEVRTERAITII